MKPLHSHAIDNAILAIGRASLQRSNGGYGAFPRGFVPLKTARRVIDLGFAVAEPKFAGRTSLLTLTPAGRAELARLRARQEGDA